MLGRYKTAILSKQSTFPGLCRDAAAAGAPGMICAFARVARRRAKETEKKKKKKKKRRKRRGRREKICTVCTLESFANVPPSSSRHFRYVSNRGPTYFHFSQPLSRGRIAGLRIDLLPEVSARERILLLVSQTLSLIFRLISDASVRS